MEGFGEVVVKYLIFDTSAFIPYILPPFKRWEKKGRIKDREGGGVM